MTQPLLSIRDLRVRFAIHGAALEAVRGVSFDIAAGDTVALVGESGSGKSVIARAIMGLLPENATITAGQILLTDARRGLDAVDTAAIDPNSRQMRALRGGSVSLIFQEPMVSLSALHTIGDQISEALFLHRAASPEEGRKLTRDMLAIVGFPEPERALTLYPFELSGGMRQRAMIAMALICRPSLLIADEPTTALDVTIQAQILKLIKNLQTQLNMAVLMITHDLGVVANVARQVVVLYHGEVMERAPVADLFGGAQHAYTRALLRAVPNFGMAAGERLTPLREIKTEIGRFLSGKKARAQGGVDGESSGEIGGKTAGQAGDNAAEPSAANRILAVRDLAKSFSVRGNAWSMGAKPPKIQAVKGIDFDLRRGECLGLVGESGSGKSTLGKLIAHAIAPDSGSIVYFDRDSGDKNADKHVDKTGDKTGDKHAAAGSGADAGAPPSYELATLDDARLFDYRCRVQYIFQDPVGSLNPSMTLFDIIREPMEIHRLGGRDYQMDMSSELMRLVGLDPRHLRRYPHSFSGGQRQRIGIARALALQPDLLICDEPVSALDVSIQAQVLNLMKDLQSELGLSYLFISHNLAVVDYIADRIAVMYRGEFVELAPRQSLFQQPTHPYTRSLLQAIPSPDLDHLLDFSRIKDAGDGTLDWPAPYAVPPGQPSQLFEINPAHWVRATHSPVP